jgi:hypothetical protein
MRDLAGFTELSILEAIRRRVLETCDGFIVNILNRKFKKFLIGVWFLEYDYCSSN